MGSSAEANNRTTQGTPVSMEDEMRPQGGTTVQEYVCEKNERITSEEATRS
jgi:hypothetical protein